MECKIFRILLKHVSDHLSVLFSICDCTFKASSELTFPDYSRFSDLRSILCDTKVAVKRCFDFLSPSIFFVFTTGPLSASTLKNSPSSSMFHWSFNPNLGGFLSGSFCGGRGSKITLCPKLVRITLRYAALEITPFSTRTLFILLMSASFWQKINIF